MIISRLMECDGPQSLAEILDMGQQVMKSIRMADKKMRLKMEENLKRNLEDGIVLTSSYSGLGSAEIAASMLQEAAHNGGNGFHFWSAVDVSRGARVALQQLGGGNSKGPDHIFQDIMDRIPTQVRQNLQGILKQKTMRYKAVCNKHGPKSSMAGAAKKSLGMELLKEASALLHKTTFASFAYCLKHKQMCCLNPRLDPELQDRLWVEVAGTVCKPWSTMGTMGDWLHPTSLVFLVWAFSMRFYEPDMILQECTRRFDYDKLYGILAKRGHTTRLPIRSPFTRYLPDGKRIPTWKMKTEIIDPLDLGIPSRRPRRYTYFWIEEVVDFPWPLSIKELFSRSLQGTSALYKVATSEQVNAMAWRVQGKHTFMGMDVDLAEHMNEDDSNSAFTPAAYLPASKWVRMQHYIELAKNKGLMNGMGQPAEGINMIWVNLETNPQFGNMADVEHAPTLMTNSSLFDLVDARMLMVMPEHFVIQGFPAPCDGVPERLSKWFPWCQAIEDGTLSTRQCKVLTGNAMHLSVVGSCLAYLCSGQRR